jgi:hypothetical protein
VVGNLSPKSGHIRHHNSKIGGVGGERGFAIYGAGSACVDLRGFFDWGRSCVALRVGSRPGAAVVIVSASPGYD